MISRVKIAIGIVIIVIIWLICKFYINIEVSKQKNKIVDSYEEKISQIKIQLQTDKIELEKKLKEELITSKTDLEKCKLEKETETKKKQFSDLSKKNPKEFKREVDKTLGVREKRK